MFLKLLPLCYSSKITDSSSAASAEGKYKRDGEEMMEESMNETWKLNKEANEEMKMTGSKFIINHSEEVKKQSKVTSNQ